jgi:outer membrane protein assembly factor BamB
MVSPSRQPVYFGTHQAGHPARMACTDDGSLVVVASSNTTAWDRQAAKLLWRREAPIVEACQFLPRSRRLICSLATGEIVELDPLTGDVLRLIDRYPYPITHLGVAPGGDRLAAVNSHKVCVLADLETGGAIWSRQFSWVAVGPQFSPDGRTLLVPNPEEGVEIAEVSSVSGKTVGTLSGVGGHIMALRVTDDGTVYAWNDRGTITAWSLANRTITRQFTPSAIEQELTP